jgi:hypothetical protein
MFIQLYFPSIYSYFMVSRNSNSVYRNLVAPSGGRMQSEAEILDRLLATHFPYSVPIDREAVPAAAIRPKRLDWHMNQ